MTSKNPMRRSWLDDGGWIPHRLTLVMSPSWRERPIPVCRLLERIEIEHMRHGGKENGCLCVSYGQLVEFGMSRRVIHPSIVVGQGLGLLDVIVADGSEGRSRTNFWADRMEPPNLYRLTYVPEKGRRAPTDEWASVTAERVAVIVAEFRLATSTKAKAQFSFQRGTSSLSCIETPSTSSLFDKTPVPERELSIISAIPPDEAQPGREATPHKGRARVAGAALVAHSRKGRIHVSEALAGTKIGKQLGMRQTS